MKDGFGRTISYMRISITDRCNLRCRYCMPHGIECVPMDQLLTFEEYAAAAAAAVRLGIRRFKITGGEPLARRGCCRLIAMLKQIPGVEQVTITTNGALLPEYLDEILAAGTDGINISLDTLDPELYRALTGGGDIRPVLEVLERLTEPSHRTNSSGKQIPVKINAVSLDLAALSERLGCSGSGAGWTELLSLAKEYPFDLRFIEMMPVGYGKQFASVDHRELLRQLKELYPDLEQDQSIHGNGPAVYYRIPGFRGGIGLISAMHGK
ncbi:MAG: radical SAM protein, partial [Eubacteriales bacterium]|nr:radical SAM protein [Eubacteriales bacterium]